MKRLICMLLIVLTITPVSSISCFAANQCDFSYKVDQASDRGVYVNVYTGGDRKDTGTRFLLYAGGALLLVFCAYGGLTVYNIVTGVLSLAKTFLGLCLGTAVFLKNLGSATSKTANIVGEHFKKFFSIPEEVGTALDDTNSSKSEKVVEIPRLDARELNMLNFDNIPKDYQGILLNNIGRDGSRR